MKTVYDFTVKDRQGQAVSPGERIGARFFTNFLIDREGKVIARFEPAVDMKEVGAAVEAAL